MNNYNIILECIDEINDSVVTTESNVIKSLMNSYYKQYELFTECEYLGKDPYKIYQEASIMDEVKEKSSKDKNKLITFLKFIPRLIITIIKKIKNKLFGKKDKKNTTTVSDSSSNKGSVNAGNGSNLFNKDMIEKTRKAVSNSKNGKIVLGGGVIVTALASGGLVISKVIKKKGKGKKSGKSKDVKIEITKDNKIKCNFNIKKIKGLQEKLVRLIKRNTNKINDGKVPSNEDVNQIEEVVVDLKKEITGKNNNPDIIVDNSDLVLEEGIAEELKNIDVDKMIETVSKYNNGSDVGDKQNNILNDQTSTRFVEMLAEAIPLVSDSVDTIIETREMLESQQYIQFNDNDNSGQKKADGKRTTNSNGHTYDDMIKDNCEKLKMFCNSVLIHLKDIEDLLPNNVKALKHKINIYMESVEKNGSIYSNVKTLATLHEINNFISKTLIAPIHDEFDNEKSDDGGDTISKNEVPKVLKYLKHVGYEDMKFDVGTNIDKYGQFFNVTRINTDDETKEGTIAKLYMKPLYLNLSKIGLSHIHQPRDEYDIIHLRGICDKYECKQNHNKDYGEKKSESPKHDGVGGAETKKSDKISKLFDFSGGYYDPKRTMNTPNFDKSEKGADIIEHNVGIIEYIKTRVEALLSDILLKQDRDDLLEIINKAIGDAKHCVDKGLSVKYDIVSSLHSAIYKYVYDSFTKVDGNGRKVISRFLKAVGYEEVKVRVGDDFESNAKYFEKALLDATDDPDKKGKISKIDRVPYGLARGLFINIDGTPVENEYILGGICTYYKK